MKSDSSFNPNDKYYIACQERYRHKTQDLLSDAFDYAVNVFHFSGDDFVHLFLRSSACSRLERKDITYILGRSGIEMALDIIEETTGEVLDVDPQPRYFRTREYWVGWALAYYKWQSKWTYQEIFSKVPFSVLREMYNPLHEADISKFISIMDTKMN